MRSIRPALIITILSACTPAVDDSCRTPRALEAIDCAVYDGGQWTFDPSRPLPELDAFCAAACVDIDAPVQISGYEDLTDVPLLPKIREIRFLSINVDTLENLRGMETVDIVGSLQLEGTVALYGEAPRKNFTSMSGLTDEYIPGLTFRRTNTRVNLAASSLKRVDFVTLEEAGLVSLDLSVINPTSVNVAASHSLTSIRFGDGPMQYVSLSGNESLQQLEWPDSLIVTKRIDIDANKMLSTCLINDFLSSTDAGPRRVEAIHWNGPCP